jgi:hypothetical protein
LTIGVSDGIAHRAIGLVRAERAIERHGHCARERPQYGVRIETDDERVDQKDRCEVGELVIETLLSLDVAT